MAVADMILLQQPLTGLKPPSRQNLAHFIRSASVRFGGTAVFAGVLASGQRRESPLPTRADMFLTVVSWALPQTHPKEPPMPYTLTQLAADIREALKTDSGRSAKETVCTYVTRGLADEAFIATHRKERATGDNPSAELSEHRDAAVQISWRV